MTDLPTCSAIVVTYNGRDYLDRCIGALLDLDYPPIEILAIDNGSRDGSVDYLREQFPGVTVYENASNNFASAVQWGIDHSSGEFVALVNNDTQLDRQWLRVLAEYLRAKRSVGGVAGKICFPDGRIDSVGHVRLADHYWSDRGMGERDRGQYNQIEAVEGLCWAAALFRRECLDEVGEIDRQFVMYFEDVDYAERCRQAGWELHYVPEAIALHEGGASSQGSNLTDYFCNRNRFLFLAKHEPDQLFGAIETSGFLIRQRWDWLLEAMTMAWHKLMLHHDAATVDRLLPGLVDRVAELCGARGVDLALAKLSAIHGDRPLTIAIYDHALHTIGGGQRYITTLASVLQDRFAITFIANKPVEIAQIEAWYGLTLDRCQLEILPLPFFDRQNAEIDGTWVTAETPDNPFAPIADRSAAFDIFINANQLTRVEPLLPVSLFFCHFPDSWRDAHFAADRYTLLIANSDYTKRWIRKLWNLEPSLRLYPPVVTPKITPKNTLKNTPTPREPIILSVARFDSGGNKKQWEMVQAFRQLRDRDPDRLHHWRLVLVGGSASGSGESPYLEKLRAGAQLDRAIELHVNLPLEQVNGFYGRASLFWHLCGLDEFLPERVEHFGMATVEAMQQGCIPIVFDGGGQREIVVEGVSGYRVATIEKLLDRTLKLIRNPLQRQAMSQRVRDRGQCFSLEQFADRVNALFDDIAREFTTIALPDPGQIYQECKTLSVDEIQADLSSQTPFG